MLEKIAEAWDNAWINPLNRERCSRWITERKKEFEADTLSFLAKTGKSMDKLSKEEKELLTNLGASIYSSKHLGFSKSYMKNEFYNEFGQYIDTGYHLPDNPIKFIEAVNIPNLGVLVSAKDSYTKTKYVRLSNKFRKHVDVSYWETQEKPAAEA